MIKSIINNYLCGLTPATLGLSGGSYDQAPAAALVSTSVFALLVVSGFVSGRHLAGPRADRARMGDVHVHRRRGWPALFSGFPSPIRRTYPSFVDRRDVVDQSQGCAGTVRMETPVIYFYAPRAMTVNVSVQFRQGVITEWFPRPAGMCDRRHRQRCVQRADRVDERERDARCAPRSSPLSPARTITTSRERPTRRRSRSASESERFLFYRGVGRIPPPIAATVAAERADHRQPYARRRRSATSSSSRTATARPPIRRSDRLPPRAAFNALEPEGESPSPQMHLEKTLVAHGLYPREAKAMVESWRGSWFEQGTRLFYIVSGERSMRCFRFRSIRRLSK